MNLFREVQILSYSSPDIQYPTPYLYINTQRYIMLISESQLSDRVDTFFCLNPRYTIHYWIWLLCREPRALGKGLKALGKGFAESLPRGSRQRALGKEALGKEFFAESHVAGSRQRLCRGPETPSAKPTAPSRNVNIDVVFAESCACRLSAKTFYFLKKKKHLPRAWKAGSRQMLLAWAQL